LLTKETFTLTKKMQGLQILKYVMPDQFCNILYSVNIYFLNLHYFVYVITRRPFH